MVIPAAFTIRSETLTNELMTVVSASEIRPLSEPVVEKDFLQAKAIWDTGSITSVISRDVVDILNLSPISQQKITHVRGESIVGVYMIDILLPNRLLIRGVQVAEGMMDEFGMLIGMDIINLGDFALTHKDGKTVFSFQIPSTHEYDFLNQIEKE